MSRYYLRVLTHEIPHLAAVLSEQSRLRCVLKLWWFVVSRKLRLVRTPATFMFTVGAVTFPFTLRAPMDIAVLREVYLDNEYAWCPVVPKLIIDLGAHIGDTATYYAARFPEATVIAVEPMMENYTYLVQNTSHFKNIIPLHAAAAAGSGTVLMNASGSPLGFRVDAAGATSVAVPALSLVDIMDLHGNGAVSADLVKCDIEGAEFGVMTAEAIALTTAFVGEVHTDLAPGSTIEEFAGRFATHTVEVESIAGRGRYLVRAVHRGRV